MGKPSQFFSVGIIAEFVILGVFHYVAVLHELFYLFVEHRIEHFNRKMAGDKNFGQQFELVDGCTG